MFENGKEIYEQGYNKHQFWQAHIGAWERSGIRQAEYFRKASELTFLPVTIKATHAPGNKSSASLRLIIGDN